MPSDSQTEIPPVNQLLHQYWPQLALTILPAFITACLSPFLEFKLLEMKSIVLWVIFAMLLSLVQNPATHPSVKLLSGLTTLLIHAIIGLAALRFAASHRSTRQSVFEETQPSPLESK